MRSVQLVLLSLLIILSVGCGKEEEKKSKKAFAGPDQVPGEKSDDPEEPFHLHLVCGTFTPKYCSLGRVRSILTAWNETAPPQSIFSFAMVAEDSETYEFFAKRNAEPSAKFINNVMGMIQNARDSEKNYYPESLRFSSKNLYSPGRHQVEIIGKFAGLDKTWKNIPMKTERAPIHMAVVCDLSGSTSDFSCSSANLAMALESYLSLGAGVAGDSFSIFLAGKDRETVTLLEDFLVWPGLSYVGRIARFVFYSQLIMGPEKDDEFKDWGYKWYVEKQVKKHEITLGSAVVEAIDVATARLSEKNGQRYLLVISDGRQITPGAFDLEKELPSSEEFSGWARNFAVNARFENFKQIKMCGFHNAASEPAIKGKVSPVYEKVLKTLWSDLFKRLGAKNPIIQAECYQTDIASQYWKKK